MDFRLIPTHNPELIAAIMESNGFQFPDDYNFIQNSQ